MELPELEPPPMVEDEVSWAIGVMQGMGYSEAMVEMYKKQLSDMQDQVESQVEMPEPAEEETPKCGQCGEDSWSTSPSLEGPICDNCGHVKTE